MKTAKQLRIVFMGTPDFAVESLRRLVEGGYNVVAVVTTPDKPAGRGLKVHESAVKQYAMRAGLPVMQPEKLKDPAFVEEFAALDADLGIVIAFRMLPEAIWSQPRLGTFNLHASLLPQYRGAAPINRAIMNGEKESGVTTFFLNSEIDKGAVIMQEKIALDARETAGTLHYKLMEIGGRIVAETVEKIASGDVEPIPQPAGDGGLKPAPKIFREDCLIRWDNTPEAIDNHIRGLSPYPAAWAWLTRKGGEQVVRAENVEGEVERSAWSVPAVAAPPAVSVKIFAATPEASEHSGAWGSILSDGKSWLKVACRGGFVSIAELQVEGKKRMTVSEFLCGFKEIENYTF